MERSPDRAKQKANGMSFQNCINVAAAAGLIDRSEADDLIRRYNSRAKAEGPQAARDGLAAELSDEAQRRAELRALTEQTIDRLDQFARAYRRPDGAADVVDGFAAVIENRNLRLAGTPSVAGRAAALRGIWRGEMEKFMFEFRRKAGLGKRRNRASLDAMVDEAFGQQTGNAAAREFIAGYRELNDAFVDRFNAAGGRLEKRPDYFPQRHDARPILAAGRDNWIAYIKPRLDLAKMGVADLGDEKIDEILGKVWGRLVTDGALDREPGTFTGLGALANRYEDHRFLQFKNAQAWKDYNAAFGGGDVFRALTDHMDGLAKDIAALNVLGPNPAAMVEWMKQYIEREAARKLAGEPSLYRGDPSPAPSGRLETAGGAFLDRLWTQVNGAPGTENMAVADAFQALRSFLRMVNLSGTTLTAIGGDPFQQATARKFAGISQLRWFPDQMANLFRQSSRRDIVRAGVLLTQEMHDFNRAVRSGGWLAQSAEAARWLEDRVFTATGLTPWTRAGQATAARAFMFEAGDNLSKSLPEMARAGGDAARFAAQLEGFGIRADDWNRIRAVAKPMAHGEAGGMLRMIDIWKAGEPDLALRYGEAVHAFMEEAVPQGTSRTRAILSRVGGEARGNAISEIAKSSTMYFSYPVSVFTSLLRASARESGGNRVRGTAVFTSTMIFLAVGGAMQLVLRSLARGEDPPDFKKPENWLEAMMRGGALGIYGDYLLGNYERGGVSLQAKAAGPLVGFVADTLALANVQGIASGKQTQEKAGKRAVRYGQRYTPVQNMWWMRPVTQRYLWDQLEAIADPKAHNAWRQYERKLLREKNQGTWWRRGDPEPHRWPDFGMGQ